MICTVPEFIVSTVQFSSFYKNTQIQHSCTPNSRKADTWRVIIIIIIIIIIYNWIAGI